MSRLLLFLFVFSPFLANAQWNMASFKLGAFDPGATGSGFIIGYEGGTYVDRNFNYGWSIDWFHKNYTDENLVQEFNNEFGFINSELNELRAKTNLHDIPLMFNVTGKFPLAPKLKAFITGAAGVEALLIFYRSYEQPDDDEFKSAFDFAWRIGTGINYRLGSRSEFLVELTYHNSEPSWEFEVEDQGRTRVFERKYDMSGLLMRFGFRFYY